MNATFYRFQKRSNSTLAPSDSGTMVDVTFKETAGLSRGRIELAQRLTNMNYCRIEELGRYYFINEWTYDHGRYIADITCDVLSSFRTYIRNTTARVIFSSSDYDLDAIDTRINALGGYDRQTNSEPFAGALAGQQIVPSGTFVLNVLNNSSVWATGVSTAYYLSYQQMQLFARAILDPGFWEELKQYFSNPMDGIIDCYYIPLDLSQYVDMTAEVQIQIGNYVVPGVTARCAQATSLAAKSKRGTIAIPWRYADFRNLSPYTEITMFVPFCGAKDISPELTYGAEQLLYNYSVDPTTGAIQCIVYIKGEVLQEFSGNCRITLPVGQTQSRVDSILGAGAGVVTAAIGAATGSPTAVAGGVLSAIQSVVTPASIKMMGGMSGSILGAILGNDTSLWQQFHLSVTARDTSCEPLDLNAVQGNPCNRVRTLSGLSGYVQTDAASVAAPCLEQERAQINLMLNSGIYLE